MCIKIRNRKRGNERTCRLINLFEHKVFLWCIVRQMYEFFVCVISYYMCHWQTSTLAASDDRYMLIVFTGFCFILLPGEVQEVGDRASNQGSGIFFSVTLSGSTLKGGSGVHRGVFGCSNPPLEIPKALQKIVPNSTRLWKLFKKVAEFRTPTHQDVRKKGSKILKLRRFAIVLH